MKARNSLRRRRFLCEPLTFAARHLESGKKRRGAIALIVMAMPCQVTPIGQFEITLCALERLLEAVVYTFMVRDTLQCNNLVGFIFSNRWTRIPSPNVHVSIGRGDSARSGHFALSACGYGLDQ